MKMIIEIGLMLLLVHLDHGLHHDDNSTTCDFVPGKEEPDCRLMSCRDVKFVRHDEIMRCDQYWKCDEHQPHSHGAKLYNCSVGLSFIESLGRCDDEIHHPCGQICRKDGKWKQGNCVSKGV